MSIVTLTTDFGLRDYYPALIKGAMLHHNAQLNIIDITHQIKPYDIVEAAFVFKNTWTQFPAKTIHVVSVNDYYNHESRYIAIQHKDHYFIGPDNGIFSLIFEDLPREVYELDYTIKGSFPLQEIYAQAVGHILKNESCAEIGKPIDTLLQRITFRPVIDPSKIRGSVIYIDHYENVILNITRALFEEVGRNRPFKLYFKRHDPITQICQNYQDVAIGEPLCLFNSANHIEIAVNMGKASSLLGLKVEDTVQIDFSNKQKLKQSHSKKEKS